MILRKGIKAIPKVAKAIEVERKSTTKAVQQPAAKTVKAVTKISSLSDLSHIPEFATEKRFTAVVKSIDFQGNLILGNIYTFPKIENGKKTFQRMSIPFTSVPANMLANARIGMTVSYNVVDKTACNFKLESDLYTGLGLADFTRECGACINVSQAEMLAVTNGLHKNKEFFAMNATEKTEFVRDNLFAMLGENVTTTVIKNVVYYSIPVSDLSNNARILFSDKIAANTASATSASTTATNNATTTATTLTPATTANNTTASTTVNAVAA